jgi:hypothetical protein
MLRRQGGIYDISSAFLSIENQAKTEKAKQKRTTNNGGLGSQISSYSGS